MMPVWFVNGVLVFLLMFNTDPRATMVHFFALIIGIIYGIGWVPQLGPTPCESTTSAICKILSIVITVAPFVIIFMYPTIKGA